MARILNKSRTELSNLRYHKSYKDYVLECNAMLDETEILLQMVSKKEEYNTISDQISKLIVCSNNMKHYLIQAFERNGIVHTVSDEGLYFEYRVK